MVDVIRQCDEAMVPGVRARAAAGRFDLGDASRAIADKLVRRHPHVFGEEKITEAEEVVGRWEEIKKAERAGKEEDTSALAGVPKALPALQRAQRTCEKAVAAGFDEQLGRDESNHRISSYHATDQVQVRHQRLNRRDFRLLSIANPPQQVNQAVTEIKQSDNQESEVAEVN